MDSERVREVVDVWYCPEHRDIGSDKKCYAARWIETRDEFSLDPQLPDCPMVPKILVDPPAEEEV